MQQQQPQQLIYGNNVGKLQVHNSWLLQGTFIGGERNHRETT